jgi:hypothetical protein
MTSPTARGTRVQKAIRKPGTARAPKPARGAHDRATVIFRDFVRQLEKLDGRPVRTIREGTR